MIAAHEALIRQRAYEIWEEEGRPEGRQAQHWEQAMRELELQVHARTKAEPVATKPARKKAEPVEGAPKAAVKPRRTKSPDA